MFNKSLQATAAIMASLGVGFGFTHGPMILGGHSKNDPKRVYRSRYKHDAKHRKAVDGRRANVKRMQALKRKGPSAWPPHGQYTLGRKDLLASFDRGIALERRMAEREGRKRV